MQLADNMFGNDPFTSHVMTKHQIKIDTKLKVITP